MSACRRTIATMETRSKRQQVVQRPAYPQISTFHASPQSSATSASSTASSAYQSSSSLTGYPSPRPSNAPNFGQSPMFAQAASCASSAPLPSPLTQQPSHYFGSIALSTGATGHGHPTQPQATLHAGPWQQAAAVASQEQSYTGQRGAGGGAPETAPFLSNANLLAEAAKRAQMACLMRDLGDVEL